MRIWKISILVFFLLLGINSTSSQEINKISLSKNFQSMNPGEYFEIIEDIDGKLTFEDIEATKIQWEKPPNSVGNFGFSTSYFWIRFQIENESSISQSPILEFKFPRIDYLEFYNFKDDNFEKITTGDTFPFSNREIENAHFAFQLEIKPHSRQTYYIRTKSIFNISYLNPILHESTRSFYKDVSIRDLNYGILYGFLIIMTFYNLFLFFFVKEKVYIYLSFYIFAFAFVLGALHGTNFQYLYPNNPWFANKDNFIFVPIIIIIQNFLARDYLEIKENFPKYHRLHKIYILILFLFGLIINLPIMENYTKISYFTVYVFIFLNQLLFMGLSIYLVLKKFRPAYFYLLSWGLFSISISVRALAGSSFIPVNNFTFWSFQFGFAFMLIFISIGLADKINYLKKSLTKTNRQLEDYSDHLEEKIAERTEELQKSLDTVSKLKTQQDGDYFLTTLLLQPFVINTTISDKVNVDFLLIQKKKFEFYGKEQHIGGDLCHAQNITINDKNFILFFNSDAMGKSLQGSGGAIVFGSVIFSIIERAKSLNNTRDLVPERWLKNAFIELHKVFLTFECTMLVSTIIGLLEEESGLLYYINAEHPSIALYADNTCNFIEKEIYFTKLGSPSDRNKIFVNLFQMCKNDVLFIGSDGRDDFAIRNDTNELNINQNETEFLKTVQEADGDLREIYNITCQKGEIMDDYSLIRIQYLSDIGNWEHLKKLSLDNVESGNKKEAISYGTQYISKNPSDTDFLLSLGKLLISENQPKNAVHYFERLRLRNPYHFNNLMSLIDALLSNGNIKRANKIFTECSSINPTHPKLIELGKLFELNYPDF